MRRRAAMRFGAAVLGLRFGVAVVGWRFGAAAVLGLGALACTSPHRSVSEGRDPTSVAPVVPMDGALPAIDGAGAGSTTDGAGAASMLDAVDAAPDASGALAHDVAVRIDHAQRRLGPAAAIDVVDDVFVFAGKKRDAVYEASLDLARKALAALSNGRFGRMPDDAVGVFVFASTAAYEDYSFQVALPQYHSLLGPEYRQLLGFYDPAEREVVVDAAPGITTLTHELVHPLVRTDFPDAPVWINEGLASLFEAPVFPQPGEIHGTKNWRRPRLLEALAAHDPRARIDALFGMKDAAFREHDEDLHYATARYLCQWLDERGQLWTFWAAWRDGVIDDPTGARTFERIVGKAPRDAQDEWAAWVRRL